KARARLQVRQRWRKERQARARGVVAGQQARQHAAEMIEHAEEPGELGADYKLEVSLPEQPSHEKSSDEAGKESRNEDAGNEAGNEEPERPPASEGAAPAPNAEKKGASTRLRCFAMIPLIILFAWPVLDKMIRVWHLITIFLRIGTVTFGGGYVMVPQIET